MAATDSSQAKDLEGEQAVAPAAEPQRTTDFALVVGVDHYPSFKSLNGAVGDAKAFYDWVCSEDGGVVQPAHARLIQSATSPAAPVQDQIDEALLEVIPASQLEVVRPVLEHYLAYITPLRMARACTDLPGMLSISVLDCKGAAQIAPATAQAGALPAVRSLRVGDRVCMAIDNTADKVLSVALFDCAPSGRVLLLAEVRVPASVPQPDGTTLPGRQVVWADTVIGRPFCVSVPAGKTVGVERLVAIGTTSTTASLQALKRATTFASLIPPPGMRGVAASGPAIARGAAPTLDQWTSTTSSVRVDI